MFSRKDGFDILHFEDIPWTHRVRFDGMKSRARIYSDGLDAILGPGNEPHGPLEYPEGCNLISCFQGSNDHSEVKQLSTEKNYRLVLADDLEWRQGAIEGIEEKTLIDRGAGRLLMQVWRCAAGASLPAGLRESLCALFVVEGSIEAADEQLATWDLLRLPPAARHGAARFPQGATLLAAIMR